MIEVAPRSPEPAIELVGVVKAYRGSEQPAVAGVDLTIGQAEFFSLLGPSGSGKTTTLRTIAGFEQPSSGVVFLSGEDVTGVPANERDVSTVFQSYALFPHLTVLKNVEFPLKMRRVARSERRRRAVETLELVAMEAYGDRLPHQLSGGQRQRVALARALVAQPAVVLLDEPLGALDLKLRQEMQGVLKTLQRELSCTFVYVTHDQGEALAMSDRLAVLQSGVIDQVGTPEAVYSEPETAFVAEFIGRSNLIRCEVTPAGGGTMRARVGDHVFSARGEVPAGSATVAIRHEALDLLKRNEPPTKENVLAGNVSDVSFLGDGREVTVTTEAMVLTARVTVDTGRTVARGDEVLLQFGGTDALVLRG